MRVLMLTILLLASLAPTAQAASSTQTLFIIQRSINKNEVHYDARLDADGRLDPTQPVEVYWLMLAEDARGEDLNWVEWVQAYGFTIEANPGEPSFRMILRAERNRPIKVYIDGRTARAEIAIVGQPSHLERIYVDSVEEYFRPKVLFVELVGTAPKSGEKRTEKIVP
jgi:hypothetical protein